MAQLELGIAYEQAGSINKAKSAYERALASNNLSKPHQTLARKALKRLQTKL